MSQSTILTNAVTLIAALSLLSCTSGDKPDSNFDTFISNPAYTTDGPRVLFDEAHHNVHTAGQSYSPFVKMIENDGYIVSRGTNKITREELNRYDIYFIGAAMGDNDVNDDPAFTEAECDIILDWVADGGSLLMLTDHFPIGNANQRLAGRFGVQLSLGVVEDSLHYDTTFDFTHIVYSWENGGILEHPITTGRDSSERVHSVLTFTGAGVHADTPAVSFLCLTGSASQRPPEPEIIRKDGDVIVNVAYGAASPAPGWSQGLALEFGKGRIVVTGEAAMLTARLHRYDQRPIGMNTPGYDNRQLALNIMHWLSRKI